MDMAAHPVHTAKLYCFENPATHKSLLAFLGYPSLFNKDESKLEVPLFK